jgi:hypothetical protein
MNAQTEERVKDLTERFVAFEARQILIDLDIHRPSRFKSRTFSPTYSTPDDVKRELRKIFEDEENPNFETIRKYAIRFLRRQVEIADPKINPSFGILIRRIEKGKYDVVNSIGMHEYSER